MDAEKLPYVVDENVEKASKLSAQWPKIHACSGQFFGRILAFMDADEWRAKTTLLAKDADKFGDMEHRNCTCGSTTTVLTAIHDLAEE